MWLPRYIGRGVEICFILSGSKKFSKNDRIITNLSIFAKLFAHVRTIPLSRRVRNFVVIGLANVLIRALQILIEFRIRSRYRCWDGRKLDGDVPDGKVHGANMGPIWDRQDPGGPHVGPMKFAIWGITAASMSDRFKFGLDIPRYISGASHRWEWVYRNG